MLLKRLNSSQLYTSGWLSSLSSRLSSGKKRPVIVLKCCDESVRGVNGALIWKGYLFSCRFEAFDLANDIVLPADVSYSLCHDAIIYSCQQILMSYIGQHRGLL